MAIQDSFVRNLIQAKELMPDSPITNWLKQHSDSIFLQGLDKTYKELL